MQTAVLHQHAADDVQVLQQLHRAEDGRASHVRQPLHDVFDREVCRHRHKYVEDAPPCAGQPVAAHAKSLDDDI